MAETKKRTMKDFERTQLLERATELGFVISERGDEFGGGKTVIITHPEDPDYYGWFQKLDNEYVYHERIGGPMRLQMETDEVTEGSGRTLEEVSKQLRSASLMAPEEITVEPGAKVPERFEKGEGGDGGNGNKEKEGSSAPPEPKKKTTGEMNTDPRKLLDEVNEEVVREMGYQDDQGTDVSVPRTMAAISMAIKGA